MEKIITKGFICLEDDYKFIYKIAKIEYHEFEDGNFKYSFHPFYKVTDMLLDNIFQGIPGIDLTLEKEVYERKNIIPTFISERTPSEHREDLWSLLDENDMQSLNRLEWLIKTNKRYSGDRLFVIPFEGNDIVKYETKSMYDLVKRSDSLIKKLLEIICNGDFLYTDEITIDNKTRLQYYRLLMPMYVRDYESKKNVKRRGIEKAKEKKVYKGRKQIKIDPLLFNKVANEYVNGKISADQASRMLKISRATFFRRLRERK